MSDTQRAFNTIIIFPAKSTQKLKLLTNNTGRRPDKHNWLDRSKSYSLGSKTYQEIYMTNSTGWKIVGFLLVKWLKMKTFDTQVLLPAWNWPLIPKVGPCEGCLTQAKMFFFCCEPRAWASPIVVVLLPSPRGVGVMLQSPSKGYIKSWMFPAQHSYKHWFTKIHDWTTFPWPNSIIPCPKFPLVWSKVSFMGHSQFCNIK